MNLLNDIAQTVAKSAPVLAGVLTSPFASVGLSLLSGIFGANSSDMSDLLQKITSDPEAAYKLQALEKEHETALKKIEAQNYQTEVDDRKSARDREKSIKDWVPTILAVGFLLNYAGMQFYCVTHDSSANDIISARFQDVLIMIVSYYFGSSHKEK